MKSSEIIAGLDIGTTKIAMVVGMKNQDGKIEILGSAQEGLVDFQQGVYSNADRITKSIKHVAEKVSRKIGLEIKCVFLTIGGMPFRIMEHHGRLMRKNFDSKITLEEIEEFCDRMYTLPMIQGEEILKVIPQEFTIGSLIGSKDDPDKTRETVNWLIKNYEWELATNEFFVKYVPKDLIMDELTGIRNPVGSTGLFLSTKFIILTGQVAAAKMIYKCVRKAGLAVEDILAEPIASAQAVLDDKEKQAGVVLVDIGGHTSTVVVYQNGIIRHVAFIPLGGDTFTNANTESIEEFFTRILFEIKKSGFKNQTGSGIVLTGRGALLKNAANLIEVKTGMKTRIGFPDKHLSEDVPGDIVNPSYSAAMGLVMIGAGKVEHNKERQGTAPNSPGNPSEKEPRLKVPKRGNYKGIFNDGLKICYF